MSAPAYDYTAQRWLDGEAARLERLAQINDTLELLLGPRGREFARFSGFGDHAAAVASLQSERADLEAGAALNPSENAT